MKDRIVKNIKNHNIFQPQKFFADFSSELYLKTMKYIIGTGEELPRWLSGKQSVQMQEIWDQLLGQEDPLRKTWQPSLDFLPENPHGQRSLAGDSPCSGKESDTTKHTAHNNQTMQFLKRSYSFIIFRLANSKR